MYKCRIIEPRGDAKSVEQEGVFSKMGERCNIKQQRGRGHNGRFFSVGYRCGKMLLILYVFYVKVKLQSKFINLYMTQNYSLSRKQLPHDRTALCSTNIFAFRSQKVLNSFHRRRRPRSKQLLVNVIVIRYHYNLSNSCYTLEKQRSL